MKFRTLFTILGAILVVSVPVFAQEKSETVQPDAAAPVAPASGEKSEIPTVYVFNETCLFEIERNALNLDKPILERLCNTPFVKGFDNRLNDIDIGLSYWGNQIYEVSLKNHYTKSPSVNKIELSSKEVAEIFQEIAQRLGKSLQIQFTNYRNDLVQQLQVTKAKQSKAQTDLVELQEEETQLQQAAGQSNLSREAILNQMKDLENERQQLQMNQAATQSRRGAIYEEIAKIAKQTEAKTAEDPVIQNLKKICELQKEKLDNLKKMVDSGRASQDELSDQQEKNARTEIEIAQRREELQKQAGGGSAEKWNTELSEMAIQTAEMEARLNFVNNQLTQMKEKNLLGLANQYEQEVVIKMKPIQQACEMASRHVVDLQMQLDALQPPSVTILGGQPEQEEKKAEEQ